MENILEIIEKYSLTVRCLPHVVTRYLTYKDGDEHKKYTNPDGTPSEWKRSLIVQKFDLEHFEKTPPPEWYKNKTPKERLDIFLKIHPTGERKLLKEEKEVKKGGWWYVKETPDTNSTVTFSRKYDKFLAPTLEEAIKMFMDSKK